MKVALLQMNPTVGALHHNAEDLLDLAERARRAGAELALAPELCILGYPPRDLLDRPSFLAAAERTAEAVAKRVPAGLTLLYGAIGRAHGRTGRLTNEGWAARDGQVIARAKKRLLPTYDVFDEPRYFEPGDAETIVQVGQYRVLITVCEDAWAESEIVGARYVSNPLSGVGPDRVDLIANLSASPFTLHKLRERPALFQGIAASHRVPVALVNQVGGNDELLFDGRSSVWNASGKLIARGAFFDEDFVVVDLEKESGPIKPDAESPPAAAYEALRTGVRDYTRKCGFERAVIGLSGGIDSALTAAIAADALGPERVLGVAMPTRYSSEGSKQDAAQLAKNLGIRFEIIDIDPVFAAYLATLGPTLDAQAAATTDDVTLENLQARIRGATVMALSNRTGAIVLTTGNKSEIAVGYCTLYGDMVGGLAVISDLPKTTVYEIARWVNRHEERIPVSTLTKAPSAELRPDQKDSDSLPPYELLDRVLELYVERQLSYEEIVAQGLGPELVRRVLRLVRGSEYKRRQASPGLIVTSKAFGPGRRMPIAQGYEEP